MKFFMMGLVLSIIGTVGSYIVWGSDKLYYVSSGIGLILLGVGVLFSGVLGSGEQMRANYATETFEHRQKRVRFITNTVLIALPNLAVALVLYFIINLK